MTDSGAESLLKQDHSGGHADWDYVSLYRKAERYFLRAAQHPHANDEEFFIWSLLGVEFLLRAPLGKVHPSLLAKDGSMLSANGYGASTKTESVDLGTVIERLKFVVPNFGLEEAADALKLVGKRNSEVHSGTSAAATMTPEEWLPRFLRVAESICLHLDVDVEGLMGKEVVSHARSVVAIETQGLRRVVKARIKKATSGYTESNDDEMPRRPLLVPADSGGFIAECPACHNLATLDVEHVRDTEDRVGADGLEWDAIYVATSMSCFHCGLHLDSTRELHAADIRQQYTQRLNTPYGDLP